MPARPESRLASRRRSRVLRGGRPRARPSGLLPRRGSRPRRAAGTEASRGATGRPDRAAGRRSRRSRRRGRRARHRRPPAIGATWSAIRRASSSTTACATASPAGRAEHSRAGSAPQPRDGSRASSASLRRRDGSSVVVDADEREVDLAGGAVCARGGARRGGRARRPCPCPTERKAKSSTPRATPCHCSPRAARLMSFSRATGSSSALLRARRSNGMPSRPGTFVGEAQRAVAGDHAGHADDHAVDERRPSSAARLRAATPGAVRSPRSDAGRVGDGELDVLARADRPGEVAHRAAQEPRAEVEPEHERSLRHRLEVDGAVARAVRRALRLAHQAGLAAATAARARPSAWRSRLAGRSPRARSARRRGSSRAPSRSLSRFSRPGTARTFAAILVHGNKPNETARERLVS